MPNPLTGSLLLRLSAVIFLQTNEMPPKKSLRDWLSLWVLFRPEHTLNQIAEWTHYFFSVPVEDLATLFRVEYRVACDGNATFRTIVEKVVENQKKGT